MTDLQISLIIIGGLIVIGVFSYNKWQEHKTRKTVERAFSSEYGDVLMNPDAASSSMGERLEPVLHASGVEIGEDGVAAIDETIYRSVDVAQDMKDAYGSHADHNMASAMEPVSRQPRELPVDALIDCDIPIALESSVRGEKILSAIKNLRHIGNKPVHFIGRTDENEWEAVAHGNVYMALLAGIQLANRTNPLNELEYSEFVMRLREFTDTINAEPEIPDMVEVIKIAQSLHQFIVDHDVQLGVNVQSNGAPWNITTLLSALARQGFDQRTNSHLVMQDGEGEVLFSLLTNATQAAETTDRLTLLLDVPRVDPARDGYGALIACAKSLAMRLDGTVVDDSHNALSDAALADIAEQVSAFYSAMEAADIPGGSSRAMRLFS